MLKEQANPRENSFTIIRDLMLFFKRKIIILVVIGIAGMIAGFLFATIQKPTFTGEVKFVTTNESGSSPYMALQQQLGISLGSSNDDAFSGDNIIEVCKTRMMIEKTLLTNVTIQGKNQLLIDYYLDKSNIKKEWNKDNSPLKNISFNGDRNNFTIYQDSALKLIYKDLLQSLTVSKPDIQYNIIVASLSSNDQYWAKVFTETLINNVANFGYNATTKKLQDNVDMLQRKVDSVTRNVTGSLSSIASTQDVNINPARKISQLPLQTGEIKLETNRAIYTQLVQNLELAKVQLSRQKPTIQVIDTPRLPLDMKKLSRLQGLLLGGFAFTFLAVAYFLALFQFRRLKAKYGDSTEAL